MKRAKLTEMDRLDIRAAVMTRDHFSVAELSKRLGYDRRIIAVVANIDPQKFFEIREATKQRRELSDKALARKHGCSPGSIWRIAREAV